MGLYNLIRLDNLDDRISMWNPEANLWLKMYFLCINQMARSVDCGIETCSKIRIMFAKLKNTLWNLYDPFCIGANDLFIPKQSFFQLKLGTPYTLLQDFFFVCCIIQYSVFSYNIGSFISNPRNTLKYTKVLNFYILWSLECRLTLCWQKIM